MVLRFLWVDDSLEQGGCVMRLGGADGIRAVTIGEGGPLCVVAGPCVLESTELAQEICAGLVQACGALGLQLVFKASFDKANRTSVAGLRGPGLAEGLDMLSAVRERFGVPVTTDVHLPNQVPEVASKVDLLQVPAFLCRQTDLLQACGRSGRPVNIKKGQFQAPWDMAGAVDKVRSAGGTAVMVTERGSTFGYNNLVADMRSLPEIRRLGVPVCFDATHAVQLPGAQGTASGGQREMAPVLARAAVAAGVDAIFLEVHPDPEQSPSDAATILPLGDVPDLLKMLTAIDQVVRSHESA